MVGRTGGARSAAATAIGVLSLWLIAAPGDAVGKEYAVFDVVGDSISRGVNPVAEGRAGWVQMLFAEFGDHETIDDLWPGIVARNSAVSGSRASEWASPDYEPMQTLLERHPDLVVVYIGGNDMLAAAADGDLTQQEMEAFRADLETILDRLLTLDPAPDIVVGSYYDLFDGVSELIPIFFAEYRFISEATVEFNAVIAEVADEKGCFLVDGIYDAFFNHCYGVDLGSPDHLEPDYVHRPLYPNLDIHPVTAGYEAIHGEFYAMLEILKDLPEEPGPLPSPAPAAGWLVY